MTGIIITIVVLALIIGAVLVLRGGTGKPRHERLGATQTDGADPLIRTASRHRDTPAGADLDQSGGRSHDDKS